MSHRRQDGPFLPTPWTRGLAESRTQNILPGLCKFAWAFQNCSKFFGFEALQLSLCTAGAIKQIREILCVSRTSIICAFLPVLVCSISCVSSIASVAFNYHPARLGVIFKVSQYTLVLPRVKIYSLHWK